MVGVYDINNSESHHSQRILSVTYPMNIEHIPNKHQKLQTDQNALMLDPVEYQRQHHREQKRLYRANMDPIKLEALRRKDAERKRQYRASLTPEQLLEYRRRNAERKRQFRASLSHEELIALRYKNAEQKRIQRLKMKLTLSPEQLSEINRRNAERKRLKYAANHNSQGKGTKTNGVNIPRQVQFATAMKEN